MLEGARASACRGVPGLAGELHIDVRLIHLKVGRMRDAALGCVVSVLKLPGVALQLTSGSACSSPGSFTVSSSSLGTTSIASTKTSAYRTLSVPGAAQFTFGTYLRLTIVLCGVVHGRGTVLRGDVHRIKQNCGLQGMISVLKLRPAFSHSPRATDSEPSQLIQQRHKVKM